MGKQRKLKASIKALHDALISFKPAAGAPMCFQPAKTHSFRDLLTSFNSVYYVHPTPSTSSVCECCGRRSCLLYYPRSLRSPENNPMIFGDMEEEDRAVSLSATTTTASTSSSWLSSSSLCFAAPAEDAGSAPEGLRKLDKGKAADRAEEAFPGGVFMSERFFFSPRSSKYIMDECFLEMGSRQTTSEPPSCGEFVFKSPEAKDDQCKEEDDGAVLLDSREIDTAVDEVASTTAAAGGESALCRESTPIAMASTDPYRDFRRSMEEMVAAHGLQDWPGLQELLHCYLRLNEKQTHKCILVAFTDLLMKLASEGKVHSSVVHGAFSSKIYASPWPSPPPSRFHHRPTEY